MKQTIASVQRNQRGIVSLVVSIILVIVLSLIILGFSQIARHEQQRALDRQLSEAAFYAAESGANDAVANIEAQLQNPSSNGITDQKSCSGSYNSPPGNVLDSASGTEYSCLLVDPTPTSLLWQIPKYTSEVFPVLPQSSSPNDKVRTINFSWQSADDSGIYKSCPTVGVFDPALASSTSWPGSCPGVLQVDLIPLDNVNSADIENSSYTFYLYPQAGPANASPVYGPANSAVFQAACNVKSLPYEHCNVSINFSFNNGRGNGRGKGNGQAQNYNGFYVRVIPFYKDTDLVVTANASGNNLLNLKDAQAIVDATGKAAGVLQRVQVRVPISQLGVKAPEFAIQTNGSICKRVQGGPNFSSVDTSNTTNVSGSPDIDCTLGVGWSDEGFNFDNGG